MVTKEDQDRKALRVSFQAKERLDTVDVTKPGHNEQGPLHAGLPELYVDPGDLPLFPRLDEAVVSSTASNDIKTWERGYEWEEEGPEPIQIDTRDVTSIAMTESLRGNRVRPVMRVGAFNEMSDTSAVKDTKPLIVENDHWGDIVGEAEYGYRVVDREVKDYMLIRDINWGENNYGRRYGYESHKNPANAAPAPVAQSTDGPISTPDGSNMVINGTTLTTTSAFIS